MTTHWTTRAETAADIPAVDAVVRAAFPTADEADLVAGLRRDPAWIDGLSVVATTTGGTVVGHALLTRCHIDDTPALCLAPCAVLPAQQGSGAGSAAIRAVLQAARAAGEAFVVVLGHPGYYPRFGFERASAHGIGLSIDVPDDALMALSLDPRRSLPAGTVRYAAPFGICRPTAPPPLPIPGLPFDLRPPTPGRDSGCMTPIRRRMPPDSASWRDEAP
ncbi:GNAT family N-acetyltransferase [Tersicoccus phoenicis]|uniref:GNAT family N-acetyltransferase n=1 Tax=Tersicoccus phoenicis TaxID=554083 RepID=UPI000A05F144|nr:N-acetyltransferase [Tersicoccus phoenicis]